MTRKLPKAYRDLTIQAAVLEKDRLHIRERMDREGPTSELAIMMRNVRREIRRVQIQIRYLRAKDPYARASHYVFGSVFVETARELLDEATYARLVEATKQKFPSHSNQSPRTEIRAEIHNDQA